MTKTTIIHYRNKFPQGFPNNISAENLLTLELKVSFVVIVGVEVEQDIPGSPRRRSNHTVHRTYRGEVNVSLLNNARSILSPASL